MPASTAQPAEEPEPTTTPDAYPVPFNERGRVASLRLLQILESEEMLELEELTRLAAYICDTPSAVVNLIDAEEQHSVAPYGAGAGVVSRSDAMCAISIMSPSVSYTPDASKDARWADNPFVTGAIGNVRTYVASPLLMPGGHAIGTICAFSEKVNPISPTQLERMRDLAEVTVRMLRTHDHTSPLSLAATRDPLTELPNRALFLESLDLAIARHTRGESHVAILFVDLDGFKAINDTYGHDAGDELLQMVADRLLRSVRASDLVARLAGDEFVVLCTAPLQGGKAFNTEPVIRRIRLALDAPFELAAGPVLCGASVGNAYLGRDGNDAESLISHADHAMYADRHRRLATK